MIYIYLLPAYIAVNLYFFTEVYKLINSVAAIANSTHRKKLIRIIKVLFTVAYSVCALSLLLAFAIPDRLAIASPFFWTLRRILKLIGGYHEGVLIYLMMTMAVALILRLFRHIRLRITGKTPKLHLRRSITGLVYFIILTTVTALGVIQARHLYTTTYEVNISKENEKSDGLRIALVADLHLGYNIGVPEIKNMVDIINASYPDIVLIAGDIYDNEYIALDDPDTLASVLGSINSKYGTYACYGNHDIEEPILGGFTFKSDRPKESSEEMDALLQKAGITLLKDEYLLIDDSFYIYGRPDYERPNKGITVRRTPEEIVSLLDASKPIIVMDHEPRELAELAEAGVDLDLCGHTHDGQIFPLNLTSRYFTWENSAGLLKKGNMTNIVTSGVGLFGPNMRVGTKAEVCIIDVTFSE